MILTASGGDRRFERVDPYRSRRIADRFTPAMTDEYARALGLTVSDPAFFGEVS